MAPIQNVSTKINKLAPIQNLAPNINKMAPIQNVASKINKMASKINKMAPIQCLPQYSPIQPNIAQYSSVHSSYKVPKWPNLVSKQPVKVPKWRINHYQGFDCTELHLLSIDSITASLLENIWLPHSSQYQRTR